MANIDGIDLGEQRRAATAILENGSTADRLLLAEMLLRDDVHEAVKDVIEEAMARVEVAKTMISSTHDDSIDAMFETPPGRYWQPTGRYWQPMPASVRKDMEAMDNE